MERLMQKGQRDLEEILRQRGESKIKKEKVRIVGKILPDKKIIVKMKSEK